MYICYGISNGPPSLIQWREDWEEDRYLWRAPLGCEIAVQEKHELVLTVPEFDSTKATVVKITLIRKGSDMPIVEFAQNSYNLCGKPELVWGSHGI